MDSKKRIERHQVKTAILVDSDITKEIYLHITKRLKEKDYEEIKQIHVF